jgi:drug/metabolite transporter (DMT)-like permease
MPVTNQTKHSASIQMLTCFTIILWGSLYVVSRQVLAYIPALFLLLLRFVISSVVLLCIAKFRKCRPVQREDWKLMFFVGFCGYFLSNAALLLGIKYSNASFSSLVNSMTPIFITFFASIILKERMKKKETVSLVISVIGAIFIIGHPDGSISFAGILYCLFSLVMWSFSTIYIKKLTAKYDPILITGLGMGIAALFALPASAVTVSADLLSSIWAMRGELLLPVLYICIACTAVAHLIWNYVLSKEDATRCAAYYPLQPLTSMLLGAIFLKESVSINFAIGTLFILAAMVLRSVTLKKPETK